MLGYFFLLWYTSWLYKYPLLSNPWLCLFGDLGLFIKNLLTSFWIFSLSSIAFCILGSLRKFVGSVGFIIILSSNSLLLFNDDDVVLFISVIIGNWLSSISVKFVLQ